MKLDNFRLIVEVKKRRALWDSTMQLVDRKDISLIQWQEVANIMNLDVLVCKKRFKGLRDSYRCEIRKIQKRRTENSHWPYFRSLEFMRNIFDPDNLLPFKPQPIDIDLISGEQEQNNLDSFIIDVDNDDSFDFEIMGDIFKQDPSEPHGNDSGSELCVINRHHFDQSMPMSRSDVESSPRLLSPILPKVPPAKRARRRQTSSSTDGPQYRNGRGHATSLKVSPLPASESESAIAADPDRSFLVSLLPHVKMLTPMNNMKFRMEVTRLLMDLNQPDRQPIAPAAIAMPRLIPAPAASNHNHSRDQEPDSTRYGLSSTLQAANAFLAHSSIIECDVKIENEPLF